MRLTYKYWLGGRLKGAAEEFAAAAALRAGSIMASADSSTVQYMAAVTNSEIAMFYGTRRKSLLALRHY